MMLESKKMRELGKRGHIFMLEFNMYQIFMKYCINVLLKLKKEILPKVNI